MSNNTRVRGMKGLVKIREYGVPEDSAKPILINVPVVWLREFTKAGDVLGLFEHPETHQLIIDKISPSKGAS